MTLVLRPRRLRVVCWWTAAGVLLSFSLLAAALPAHAGGRTLVLADRLSFVAFGLVLALAVLALTRPRVRADAGGIWVRNVVGERFFAWGVVSGVQLPDGAPWAQLALQDDQSVALLAVQAHDEDSRAAVDELLSLLQEARAT